eukprot:CAMPEP_0118930780 /NCGR_PEP_ID=MMETSP1169-20130426/7356_1 /TAXON_ID=36882 /ORGANISM="Pyramimonas obovata, Strain CCMP722" /LENGTH=62 /DNA_ID=CAMNT_0006873191 /DNA_START=92 /DNA_END=280 /DNA_ORIENTATION=-
MMDRRLVPRFGSFEFGADGACMTDRRFEPPRFSFMAEMLDSRRDFASPSGMVARALTMSESS